MVEIFKTETLNTLQYIYIVKIKITHQQTKAIPLVEGVIAHVPSRQHME